MTHIGRPKTSDSLPPTPTLYDGWKPWHGIFYPTYVNIIQNGRDIRVQVKNYDEHHELVKSLCKK